MITHVVLFRFGNAGDVAGATDRLRGMQGRIPALRSVRAGSNSNTGPNAFDLVLITEHDDEAGLAEYLTDPHHRELGSWLADRISERAVVDTSDLR